MGFRGSRVRISPSRPIVYKELTGNNPPLVSFFFIAILGHFWSILNCLKIGLHELDKGAHPEISKCNASGQGIPHMLESKTPYCLDLEQVEEVTVSYRESQKNRDNPI